MNLPEQLRGPAGSRPVALVYPAFTMGAYAVIRNLGERGVPIVAMNPWPHPHLKSRYVAPVLSPNFAEDPEAFVAAIRAIAAEAPHGVVLYLMEDVYVYLIHRVKDQLPANVRFPFMDEEALAMSLDKRPMFEAAERAGLPLPWTAYPTSLGELEALRDQLPFPCLMKPLASRFAFGDTAEANGVEAFPRTFGGKCVRADNYEALETAFMRARAQAIPVCVQELLLAPMDAIYGVHLYADARHELLGAATGRKLHQLPADFGTGTLCEVVRRDDAVALAERFVRETRFHGIGDLEFMEDPRTGELKLIEINPRGGHWMGLSLVAGVELPYLQFADMIGAPIRQTQTQFSGRWVDGRGEVGFFQRYSKERTSPHHLGLAEWVRPIVGSSPAVLNWKDPAPGVMGLVPQNWGARYLDIKARWRGPGRPRWSES